MAGLWFSSGTHVASTNKTDCHNITETLLKMVFNTITLTPLTLKGVFKQSQYSGYNPTDSGNKATESIFLSGRWL